MSDRAQLIAIVGATATGKSTLGVQLAKRFSGEVVSADSRQIYKHMDVGTGKVTKEEMAGIPHHLLDVVEPDGSMTVAQYQEHAYTAIDHIIQRGNLPFLVGGSPMYVYAVTEGWQFPGVAPNYELRERLQKKSTTELYNELKGRDPARAETIESDNKRRLIRALEIVEALGKVPELHNNPRYSCRKIGIHYPREQLKERIETRLDARIEEGMIAEIQKLHDKHHLSWEDLDRFGLEYRWGARYLRGDIDYATMREKLIRDINRFARRQMQWFGKDDAIRWINDYKEAERIVDEFLAT